MRGRTAKSRTADLFAPVPAPSMAPPARAVTATQLATVSAAAARPRARQLWDAVVFPELLASEAASVTLQSLCMHAQAFTSFVSIEAPNALLLEIRGSVKLFGSLKILHAAIDACWRGLALQARSATAPSTLAALWLARAADRQTDAPTLIEEVAA